MESGIEGDDKGGKWGQKGEKGMGGAHELGKGSDGEAFQSTGVNRGGLQRAFQV